MWRQTEAGWQVLFARCCCLTTTKYQKEKRREGLRRACDVVLAACWWWWWWWWLAGGMWEVPYADEERAANCQRDKQKQAPRSCSTLHLPAVTYSLPIHEIILSGGAQKTRQGGRQWQGVSDGLTVGSAPSAARLGLASRPEQKTLSLQPFPLGQ